MDPNEEALTESFAQMGLTNANKKTLYETLPDWLRIVNALSSLQDALRRNILNHGAMESSDQRDALSIVQSLGTDLVHIEAVIRTARPSPGPQATEMAEMAQKVSSIKRELLRLGQFIEVQDRQALDCVDVAFSRLARAEATEVMIMQLLDIRRTQAMKLFFQYAGRDLTEGLLANRAVLELARAENLIPSEIVCNSIAQSIADAPRLCGSCHEVASCHGSGGVHGPCGFMSLPCCSSRLHDCCLASRLKRHINICQNCGREWSSGEIARMIHARVFNLESKVVRVVIQSVAF